MELASERNGVNNMQYVGMPPYSGMPQEYNGSYWYKIPGYPYWVSPEGKVANQMGHVLKHFYTADGVKVELRRCGQREKHLVYDLMRKAGIEVVEAD